jgi:hypothetical protein
VKPVAAIDDVITLVCGDQRPELLPSKPGHISLEKLKTKAGRRLFPAQPADEVIDRSGWN